MTQILELLGTSDPVLAPLTIPIHQQLHINKNDFFAQLILLNGITKTSFNAYAKERGNLKDHITPIFNFVIKELLLKLNNINRQQD